MKFYQRFFFLLFLIIHCVQGGYGAEQFEGDFYAAHSTPQYSWAQDMIRKIDPLLPNFHVLDIGCGNGDITKELAKRVPQGAVVGLDPSLSMLEKAKTQQSAITWKQMSAEAMDYQNEFDIITGFSVLHWIHDLDRALKAAHKALKADGKGYFVLCAKKDQQDRLGWAMDTQMKSERWSHQFQKMPKLDEVIHLYAPEALSLKMTQAELTVLSCEMVETHHLFASRNHFYQWIQGWSPYKTLLGDQHEAFFQDVLESYTSVTPPLDSGSIDYIDFVLHAVVKK